MLDVLHLFGNWKWTGPTELAVHLAEMQSKAGHRVRFAFGRTRGADEHFPRQIAARGVARAEGFELAKHFEPASVFRDALRLARIVREDPPDLVHCHLPSDHLVAALARPLTKRRVPVVRSTYDADGPGGGLRERWCLRSATDALVLPCGGARTRMPRGRGFDPAQATVIEPAIDTVRFDTRRDAGDGRARLGIERDAFVLGIVARVQRKRRFDVFLEVVRRLCARDPRARVVVLGGGTRLDEVAREPVRQMGLAERVLFPGVLRKDEYVSALRTFDVKAYMVPGTDGTCRAVKEAMACGVPPVVARVGMLPEIVRHDETGLVFDGDPDSLDACVERLRTDRALRLRLGAAAAAEAAERWNRGAMLRRVEDLYATLTGAAAPR